MTKDNKPLPLWVLLAFSNIKTRKGAWILIGSSVLFSLYCIPWLKYFPESGWVSLMFLIEDWSWFAMMLPVVLWYWLGLRWMDKNSAWEA